MFVLVVVVAVGILVGVALLASGRFATLDDEPVDTADLGLPEGRLLRSDDIPRLRLRTVAGIRGAVRGYRMSDVDAAMQQVCEALRAAEEGPVAARRGRERSMTAGEPQPPIHPAPSPQPERPAEPEPLPGPPPPPMDPEPTPRPEPPVHDAAPDE